MVAGARFVRAEAVLIAALGLLTFLISTFADIVEDLGEHPDHAFDQSVLESLRVAGDPNNPIGPKWFEIAAADLTALGSVAVLVVIVLVVSGFLMLRRRPLAVVLLITAGLGGLAMSQTLKLVFGRERPPVEFRAVEAVNASFPSGHAMLSAVIYLSLGAIMAKAMRRRREKFYVMAVALLLTLVVGLSRIYLGVHWATDVFGGWCVGGAWAVTCWLAAWATERWHGRQGMSRPQGLPAAARPSMSAAVTGE
jgi:undecaprenyl-diphosphatase